MGDLARRDVFRLSHGGFTVRLRPSLRAAMRLERLLDGFPALFRRVESFDTTTIREVIATAATDDTAADAFLASLDGCPLHPFQMAAQGLVLGFCAALLPPEPAGSSSAAPAKPMPWADAFADLYRIGTGWLGWTPAATWAATPTEIIEAMEGRVAHLIAMHGGTPSDNGKAPDLYTDERLRQIEEQGFDPAFDRAGMSALKARHQ
jgi:hypothetical protein